MAAVPLGMVIGAFVISRIATPSARIRMMGWLAVLSCAPLIGSAWSPPLWAVLALWTLAGAGGAYQFAAAATFVQALRPDTRARAFGVAQSGLYAVQGSAFWPTARWRSWSAPRSPSAWPAWSA
jgi:MFS family permease